MTRPKAICPGPETRRIPQHCHPFCFVCSQTNPLGLALRFLTGADGSVSASFVGHPSHEGYRGLVHGGIVAALLDGAMTHCLFAQGLLALTVELRVRYHAPVAIGEELKVRAWREASSHRMHRVRAELIQDGKILARAEGKFLPPHE